MFLLLLQQHLYIQSQPGGLLIAVALNKYIFCWPEFLNEVRINVKLYRQLNIVCRARVWEPREDWKR